MKAAILILATSFLMIICNAQEHYHADIDFENNSHLIEFDTTQQNNVWQIGIPQKSILDSAFSVPFAIITDSINNYPNNNFSSFQVKILPPSNSCWGIGWMSFTHKYDFDQNMDGGFIEVKYDNDTTWTNIIFDTDPEVGIGFNNYYSETDTIIGNIPAFTGTSESWITSYVEWIWQMGVKEYWHDSLTIRFSIITDNVDNNNEGWLIDNIVLYLFDCTEDLQINKLDSKEIKIFPNPIINKSVLSFENKHNRKTEIYIYNVLGEKINKLETYSDKIIIDSMELNKENYVFMIIQEGKLIGSGKFIIQ